jgi:formylmethanofuran dehydrogenase subunit D
MRNVRLILCCLTLLSVLTPVVVASSRNATSLSSLRPAAQASISAVLGRDAREFQIYAMSRGFGAENSHGRLAARFTPEGVELSSGNTRWRMTLRSCGYGDALKMVMAAAPRGSANRVEYQRGFLAEWYVNGPVGLEQGFTLNERPGQANGRPLTMAMDLSGNVTMASDGQPGLTLRSPDGKPVLRYRGLTARDAAGRELRAWEELRGSRLTIKVEDAKAHYPLVIDPWVQLAELTASDGQGRDLFGYSVSKSDSTVVVGAPAATVGSNSKQGAVYLFFESASGWSNMTQTAKLTASDGQADDMFGISVYVCHNVVVAGMGPSPNGSKAYVFVEPSGGWKDMTETAKLTASDSVAGDNFGSAVSISAGTIVVGDFQTPGSTQGAAYVFSRPASGWKSMTETVKLSASDGQPGDLFGISVNANRGNTVVIGATQAGNSGGGAAYVFMGPWKKTSQFKAKLTASDRAANSNFGQSVAVNGGTIVVGAKGANAKGVAYIFVEPLSGWTNSTETAQLTNPLAQSTNCYSCSVAVSGGIVAVGSAKTGTSSGVVYIFQKPASGWKTTSHFSAKVIASDHKKGSLFGFSLGFDGILAVGAPGGGSQNQGTGYVF